jgi:hypothetical protein
MKLSVRVIPNAKQDKIVQEKDRLKVYLSAKPVAGEANRALIECLSQYFKLKKNRIKIIRGEKSRNKLVEVA